MSSVDVVVVAYNSRDKLRGCLEPLIGHAWIHPIVVDNASPDHSFEAVAEVQGVELLRMERNGGFSYGCNAGWRAGSSSYVLFLNPDAVIRPGDLASLAGVLDANDRIGIVGPSILHEDGTMDYSIRRFPSVRSTFAQALFLHRLLPRLAWTDEIDRDPRSYDGTQTVDWLSGACLLVRRRVLVQIDGFDEGFFLYAEDIDLCRRTRDAGFEVVYTADARCTHIGGASHPRAALMPVLAESRVRYARKHRKALAAGVERLGIALGEALHAIGGRGGAEARRGHIRALAATLRTGVARRPSA